MELVIENINGKKICVKGIGKLFYEQGYPISLSISELKKSGIEVSILHIANELINQKFPLTRIVQLISEDLQDDPENTSFDLEKLQSFCYGGYEKQRKMLFDYLFENDSVAKEWFKNKLK